MGQLARVTPEVQLAQALDSWEACVSEWISRRQDITRNLFVLGLVASTVETTYKSRGMQEFADAVGDKLSTVYLYRDVYRKCYQFSKQLENLTWTHFVLVARAELTETEREAVLNEAADGEWKTPKLKRQLGIRAGSKTLEGKAPIIDPQMAAAISHWNELKPKVEKFAESNPQFGLYANDFIGDVDEEMASPWESARTFIERRIFKGEREIEVLATSTKWLAVTVKALCDELVEAGTHEWRDQGGKTDDARGAVRQLIVPIKEPRGDAYESYHGDRMGMIPDDDD